MKNKNWLLLALLLAFNSSPAQAIAIKPNTFKPEVLAEISHKDGKTYEFRELHVMTPNVNSYRYDFGSEELGYEVVYKGQTYTDSDNCPHSEYAKKTLLAETALIKHTFFRRDFNFDGIEDINLSLATEDCKTGKITFFEKLILSTKDGFKVEHKGCRDE